jgi:hypothetical protein
MLQMDGWDSICSFVVMDGWGRYLSLVAMDGWMDGLGWVV